jgi:hypothetical protein
VRNDEKLFEEEGKDAFAWWHIGSRLYVNDKANKDSMKKEDDN